MVKERRIEGPTPNGGAYAIAYSHASDVAGMDDVEIVEFTADGRAVFRTYGEAPSADAANAT